MGKKAVLIVFAVVLLSYWLYCPIPPGYSSGTSIRLSLSLSSIKALHGLCHLAACLGYGTFETNTRALGKKVMGYMNPPEMDGIKTTDSMFDGVPVRIYEPLNAESKTLPGVVYYHGGGWVFGSIETVDDLVKRLSLATKAVFVSVEYRMAPEFLFPAAFDDCVTATKFFLSNAAKFRVDANRVAVSGDSAGGNLAATVSMRLRDEQFIHQPKLQVLIYPVVQGLDFDLPSMLQNRDGPLLTRQMMTYFTANYLGGGQSHHEKAMMDNSHVIKSYRQQVASTFLNLNDLPKKFLVGYDRPKYPEGDVQVWNELQNKLLDPYYSPLAANNLENLPTAYIFLANYDPLRDEGWLYAEQLKKGNVKVKVHLAENGFHGMANFIGKYPEVDNELKNMTDFIVDNL